MSKYSRRQAEKNETTQFVQNSFARRKITIKRSRRAHDWVTSQTNADDEAKSQINQHQVTFPATRERIITSTQKLICQSVVSQTR